MQSETKLCNWACFLRFVSGTLLQLSLVGPRGRPEMQISLRSQLIAGAAAIVGTSAVAITPIAAPAAQLATLHSPSVALTAFANPVAEFMGSMSWVSADLLSTNVTEGAPFNMFDGLLPEWAYINNPIGTQMHFNQTNYGNELLQGLLVGADSSFVTLSNMVWNLPAAGVAAFQAVLSGDIPAAIDIISDATVLQIEAAIGVGIETVAGVVQQVIENVVNVLSDIPNIVTNFVNMAVGVGSTLASTAITSVTNVFNAISTGDIEGAWDAAVIGAWGQQGYAGALETLTIGPGYGTWGNVDYIPSIRVFVEGTLLQVANDLGADWNITPPAPTDEVESAAAVKAAASVAAADEVATTEAAAEATTGGIDAPKSDDTAAAPAAIAANAADSASTAGGSSKAGDNDAKGAADSKGSDAKSAAGGAKGHAKSHGAPRTKADNAA